MKKQLTLALALATTLTLTACEEKKKQDGTTPEPAAATETQQPSQEAASESQPSGAGGCPKGEPPKTVEAVFLENEEGNENDEGLAWSRFRLSNGEEIELNGYAPDDVKKGDKVSVTYKNEYQYVLGDDPPACALFPLLESVKKIGKSANILTDTRDKKIYWTTKIGEQVWMAENLNYETKNSKCYENDEANCKEYGRFYDWQTATKACPSGWHLPSDAEWDKILPFGDKTAATQLKAKSGWNDFLGKTGNGTDKYGFAALPSGEVGGGSGFQNIGNYTRWWSSTPTEGESCCANYRFILNGGDSDADPYDNKNSLNSVRCIKD